MRAVFLVAAWLAAFACAAQYPARPVRVVVPSSAGGAADIAARILAPRLAEQLGQPFVVENRAAAGTVAAAAQIARAEPDGHTLMLTFDSFAVNPHLYRDVPYDIERDFTPIALVARYVQVLVAHPSLGARSLPEFVALARARGAAGVHFATGGAASSSRLAFELFREAARFEAVPVHYKGGHPAFNDLLAGTVPVMLVQAGGPIQPAVKAGKLLALATSGRTRSPYFPDVPTLAETFPGYESYSWSGLVAPAGLAPEVVKVLVGATLAALAHPDTRERFGAQAAEATTVVGAEFGEFLRAESRKWGRVVRERGIRAD